MTRLNQLGEVRRSQVVTTFGPGAILDFRAGRGGDAAISVVADGLEAWEAIEEKGQKFVDATTIHEPRLQKLLRVSHFRLAPVAPQQESWRKEQDESNRPYLTGLRFPNWLLCPRCNRLRPAGRWKWDPGDPAAYCARCSKPNRPVHVVPVRFVVACSRGHLEEFPWHFWVQHRPGCDEEQRELSLESHGTGLGSLILRCSSCEASRSMQGIFGKTVLPKGACHGRRPWLRSNDPDCGEQARVVQRGASNLHFAVTQSALDIPPWSDQLARRLGAILQAVQNVPAKERLRFFQQLDATFHYTRALRMTAEEIIEELAARDQALEQVDEDNLRPEEYRQFLHGTAQAQPDTEFEARHRPVPQEMQHLIRCVVEVPRLREVRALLGFTRIFPPSGDPGEDRKRLAPLAESPKEWLPAIEVRGEGLFLQFDSDRLRDWEDRNRRPFQVIAEELQRIHQDLWTQRGGEANAPARDLSCRMLLVHSFSHALMRQLALECGYNSASLRERLYVSEEPSAMAGVLIYTATSDADGTLGGLSRQAQPARMARILEGALANQRWCSNDPLCISGTGAISEPMNRAACHACLLAPETSCELFNQVLDRSMLFGSPDGTISGYFEDRLTQVGG